MLLQFCRVNSVPKDKILTWSNLKVFADKKFQVAQMPEFVPDRVVNKVGKGEKLMLVNSIFTSSCIILEMPLFH